MALLDLRFSCGMLARLSFLIRNLGVFAPKLIGTVGDVLLVAVSDRLVSTLATILPVVAHVEDRLCVTGDYAYFLVPLSPLMIRLACGLRFFLRRDKLTAAIYVASRAKAHAGY